MFKKLSIFVLILLAGGISQADVTSYDHTFVANDVYSSDFHTRLNANFSKSLTGGINNVTTNNVKDDTLAEADMADEINPRIRTYEGASCEFVYQGLLPVTSASLTTDTSAGTAYPRGYRVIKNSATTHSYTASKWTYLDLDSSGNFQYSEVAIGAATPAVASNSIRLARVSTDAATVNTVTDLRTTSCTAGPFDIIADDSGEATLADILENGSGGWSNGLNIVSKDATSVYMRAGTAYINGEYRTSTVDVAIPLNSVGSPTQGTNGLDTGSIAGSTTYYLYGVADLEGVKPVTGIFSTSSSAPTGATNYRRLGEITTDPSASVATADGVSVSYAGKIRQIKRFQTGALATGTRTIPKDDTIPVIASEGDTYMTLPFTPTNAKNTLKIDVNWNGSSGATDIQAVCIARDDYPFALACQAGGMRSANLIKGPIAFTYYMLAGQTTSIPFKVISGNASAGTTYFNGESGRLYGGALNSSITITEYEA